MKNERGIEISRKLPSEEMYCWQCAQVHGLPGRDVTIKDEGVAYRCNACGETGRICACCGHPLHGQVLPQWFVYKGSEKPLFYCTSTCRDTLKSQYGELIEDVKSRSHRTSPNRPKIEENTQNQTGNGLIVRCF